MLRPNVLIVVVDGLRASALGAYGNTTYPTPAFDRFAADSLLCDWCFASAVDLEDIYKSMWRSLHPARLANAGETEGSAANASQLLPSLFAKCGYRTTLVSDDPQTASFDGVDAFQKHLYVKNNAGNSSTPKRARDVLETELAQLFADASEAVASSFAAAEETPSARQPHLVWVHARGLYGTWDAPLELQETLIDEGDPSPMEDTAVPDVAIAARHDPDAVFRYACGYAGQIMALDACWQALLDVIDGSSDDNPWLIAFMGARGFPLGEHGRIGGVDSRLYAEQLHVPCLIRFPDGRSRLARESNLVTHLDLMPALRDGVGLELHDENTGVDGVSVLPTTNESPSSPPSSNRETLCSVSGSNFAIRTGEWCLRDSVARHNELQSEAPAASPELFVRPDDRWEANDISKLCPDVVDELRAAGIEALRQFGAAGF